MITEREFKDKVTVQFIRRDDGGLQARCDSVPGFYLSGADASAVYRDVIPALETLVRRNMDIPVRVYPLRPGVYQLEEKPDDSRIPDQQDYLVERVAEVSQFYCMTPNGLAGRQSFWRRLRLWLQRNWSAGL